LKKYREKEITEVKGPECWFSSNKLTSRVIQAGIFNKGKEKKKKLLL